MEIPDRPTLREIFLHGDRRLEVFFYTSNLAKYLHAATVFERSGLVLKQFKSKTDPYHEDYSAGKETLLVKAINEVTEVVGRQSLFFVEDTSVRIEALSEPSVDFPGLAVKEWFASTSFEALDATIKKSKRSRAATIYSDIALHIPNLPRPVFVHGEVSGQIADSRPTFDENVQFPWLTPNSFNGWFIPEGANKRLGEMSLEESWQYDFRTRALEKLCNKLEEYSAILNLPPRAYWRPQHQEPTSQFALFPAKRPVFVVVGKICAGKTTFGERASRSHGLKWAEASNVLRTFRSHYDIDAAADDFDFARHVLETKGADIVSRKILQLYSDDISSGLIVTGFRAIEELEYIRTKVPHAQIVLVEAPERTRFQRHLSRGRGNKVKTIHEFRAHDARQWSFGLLRVAEDFADIRIQNDGTLQAFWEQIDSLVRADTPHVARGVSHHVHPRHGLADNQLFRCLDVIDNAGRPLTCQEIQKKTAESGSEIRHNNANKVLKRVSELAKRYDLSGERVRYEITNAGRAYIRYMKSSSVSAKKH